MSFHDRLREYRDQIAGDFVPALEAERFLKLMQDEYPGELAEWFQVRAVQFVADELTTMLRRERAIARRRSGARAFAAAVEAHEAGDSEPLGLFRTVHVIGDDNVRRPVADMTGPDHRYVAGQYRSEGNRALMLEAFHLAVAKKVGKRRTADVLTEDEYERMLNSITGQAA